MAFAGSSFNLFTDSGLTSAFSGDFQVISKTDLSDNPQTFTLYLGSPLSTRQLQAASSPGTANITFTPVDILPIWVTLTAYVVGNKIQPIGGNGFVYACTTAGTVGASQPSWPTSPIGATVVDGTAIWTLVSAHHAITEIRMALTALGVAGATPGAALSVGTTVTGGTVNAVPIYLSLTNAVTTVVNNTGNEEIGININTCIETGTA